MMLRNGLKRTEQKKQLKGFNSYVANETKFEYQIDLFIP